MIDGSARFIGLLDHGTADGVTRPSERATTVGEILARDEGGLDGHDDDPLEAVLGNEALRRLGALVAVDGDGRLQRRDHRRRGRPRACATAAVAPEPARLGLTGRRPSIGSARA